MKPTGIVRRVDDLGRVVMPKELRKTLRIRDGDPLEIFVSENSVMLRKYALQERYSATLRGTMLKLCLR